MGEAARLSSPTFHLCHNAFYSDNILLDPYTGALTIIDWDNPIWEPRERDLLFITPEFHAAFERGYGPLGENPKVASYVYADWLMQDLLYCFSRLLSTELDSPEHAWALDTIATLIPKMRALLS